MASSEHRDEKENRYKRQDVDSPSTVMSPSVRPPSKKLTRLSDTPLRRQLADTNQIDPNIDATLLEQSSVTEKSDDRHLVKCPDPNIEETLVEETSITVKITTDQQTSQESTNEETGDDNAASVESTPKVTLFEEIKAVEKSVASEDGQVNVTTATPSSIAAVLSPGMSDEMKTAIKTYLKSDSERSTTSMDVEVEETSTTDDGAPVMDSMGADVSVPDPELSDELTNIIFRPGSTSAAVEKESESAIAIALPAGSLPSQLSEAENEETAFLFKAECPAKEPGGECEESTAQNRENLTLSARKKKVLETRNLQLDDLVSPAQLSSYAQQRAEEYSFLINEAYCNTSVLCENCYAMRVELQLFSDKFMALAVAIEGGKKGKQPDEVYAAELGDLLREKQAEILRLASNVEELTGLNDQLQKQKEAVQKDVEDYGFLLQEEKKKRLDDVRELRNKLYKAEDMVNELQQKVLKQSTKGEISSHVEFKCMMEQMLEEIKKLNTSFSSEKLKFDGLEEAVLDQFSDNRKCFLNSLQELQKNVEEKLTLVHISATERMEQFHRDMSEKLERKWEEHREAIVIPVKSEMRKMSGEIESLQDIAEEVLRNSILLLEGSRKDGPEETQKAEFENQLKSLENKLDTLKRENDTLKIECEHNIGAQQTMQCTVERLQRIEGELKSQNATLFRRLESLCENITLENRIIDKVTAERDKLANENTHMKDTIYELEKENKQLKEKQKLVAEQENAVFRLEEKNKVLKEKEQLATAHENTISQLKMENMDLKEKQKVAIQQAEELQKRVLLLEKENDRLGKACDDADEEVGELKQQIYELTHANAKLLAEMHGEGEEAVNRRLGNIEAPPIMPKVHSISPKMESGAKLPANVPSDTMENPSRGREAEVAEGALEERLFSGGSPKTKTNRDQSCRTS